ncbi:Zinc finger HIT domain-containing protein 1 [Coemansia sp. RSA 2703]|nr:Zinc finger HIT domain-containing protein 1 [Coemansia sp. RSA 2703]KAJ2371254.1 Zinc finger HIT domain-containing protein 1 [Coemansia sp. RSA 2607]
MDGSKSLPARRQASVRPTWDASTLLQRRRTRVQMLERENHTTLPDFDHLHLASAASAHASKTKIAISSAAEGLKRRDRKETRALALRPLSFADLLATESQNASARSDSVDSTYIPTYHYLSCTTLPTIGSKGTPPAQRHFCSICGYRGSYTCVDCGVRYCSLECRATHVDTRCLKHVV